MSSLALAMNRGGGGDIRRQRSTIGGNSTTQRRQMSSGNGRSTPTRYANKMNHGGARMDFSPSNSNTNRRKSYTQTHLQRQPKKSKSRKEKANAPSKMMFYTTSARKDPSLARNRFKRFGGAGVSDVRSDYGTTRNNEDSSRDRAANDDHPHIVTIGTEGKKGGEVADFVDEIGDAILEANESMWQLIFNNDAMTKVIFPVEGNGEVEGNGGDDSLEDGGGIPQASSVDYFMNCTQTTFDGSPIEMTNSMYEATPTSDAPKKKSGGLLGIRRRKTKSSNGQRSTKVLDAIAEGGELGDVAETRQEDGVSVANSAGSDGLVRESMALLTIYNKSIDVDEEEQEQEEEEKEKEEEQKQEEGVEAVTAIALCGDETTVVSSDQLEMTLQEYSAGAATAAAAFTLAGDDNTIVPSEQKEVTLQEFTEEKKPRKKLLDVNAILCQNPEHILDDDYTGFPSDASSTSSSSTSIVTKRASLKDEGGNGSVSRKSISSKKGEGAIEDAFEPEKVLVGVPTLDMTMTSFDVVSQKNDDAISTISMQTDLKSRANNTGGLGYGRSLLNALTGFAGENDEGESRVTEESETTFNATTFDGSIGSGCAYLG